MLVHKAPAAAATVATMLATLVSQLVTEQNDTTDQTDQESTDMSRVIHGGRRARIQREHHTKVEQQYEEQVGSIDHLLRLCDAVPPIRDIADTSTENAQDGTGGTH